MEIKVREVTKEEKSTAEVEQALLEKHEDKYEDTETQTKKEEETTEAPVAEERRSKR